MTARLRNKALQTGKNRIFIELIPLWNGAFGLVKLQILGEDGANIADFILRGKKNLMVHQLTFLRVFRLLVTGNAGALARKVATQRFSRR
jgi:hypothetical protein